MFLFTVTKPGLRQAGALALCAVCLAGTVTAAVRLAGKSVAASATVQTTIENTQDIGTYFTGYGFEVDLSTAAVDKVKIPKKWDDSFTAFNQVVGESGLTLADYKGKTGTGGATHQSAPRLEADKGGLPGGAVELAHPDDAGHRPLRHGGPGGRAGIQDYTG